MSNTGLKNAIKISRLNISGSADITTKNDFGVHVFADTVDEDGIVFGKLTKPKYNITELQNTINTSIYELIPKPDITPVDLVLRGWWTDEVAAHAESKKTIAIRDTTITNLNNTINILNTTVESLNIQLDAQSLIAASAQNQSQQAMTRVKTNIAELQNATQKSISEVIGRVSAEARNKSLEDDISSLKDQLYGRSAKAQEGAQLGSGFAVKVVNISDSTHTGLVYRYKGKTMADKQWINGPVVEITNYTNVSTTFTITTPALIIYIDDVPGDRDQKITVPANTTENITFVVSDTAGQTYWAGVDTEWDGFISFKSGQTSSVISLQIALQDQYAGAFGPNPTIKTI